MHSQIFGILMGPLLPPSAASSARSTAATAGAGKRPLLGSRAALRTALPELPCLSPAVHIDKCASRTLRACGALGATSRPLSGGGAGCARPACSTYATYAARTTWTSHTSNATNSARSTRASRTSGTTDAAWTLWSSYASHTAGASRTSYASHTAGASRTSYASHTAGAARASRTPDAAWTGRGPHGVARYGNLRTAGQPHRSAGRTGKVGRAPTRVVGAPTG
jgi:hypothetical protein